MVDYYAILSRAIDASEASDRSWRGNLYDRGRRTLASEMRARRPQPTQAEIARELAALEAAIKRIEAESARSESADNDSASLPAEPDQPPLLGSLRWRRPVSIAPSSSSSRLYAREPTLFGLVTSPRAWFRARPQINSTPILRLRPRTAISRLE